MFMASCNQLANSNAKQQQGSTNVPQNNDNGQGTGTVGNIEGITWEVIKMGTDTFPQNEMHLYYCFDDGKMIQAIKQDDVLLKGIEASYELSGNNKIKITWPDKSTIDTMYIISGNSLKIDGGHIEAVKVENPTVQEIKNAPQNPGSNPNPNPNIPPTPGPTPDPNPPAPSEETLKEGIYIGVLSFDETTHVLTEKPIFLDYSGQSMLKSLLRSKYTRATAGGTLLYYTVHKALSTLRSLDSALPVKTSSCNIITFTDGIDVGSTNPLLWKKSPLDKQNFGGKTGDEYLVWLNKQLEDTKIKGKTITASAYGIAGADVSDHTVFADNLKKLTTQSGEADTSINFDKLSEKFGEIAQSLTVITHTTSFDLLITPPTTGNGTIYKMTFDSIGQTSAEADSSAVYFTGKYEYDAQKEIFTLSDIAYQGIKCAHSSITGTEEGNKIKFHFDKFDLETGKIEPNNIQQWFKGSSGTVWQRNSEYDQSNTTTTKEDKSSAVIYLALDSSKSLSEENIDKVRSAAENFIDVLYERYNK